MFDGVGRLLLVLLPVSAIATAILAVMLPETAWPDAAMYTTLFFSLSLAMWQWRRKVRKWGRGVSPLALTFLDSAGASEADFASVHQLDRLLRENRGRWLAIYLIAAALGAVLLRMISPAMPWRQAIELSLVGGVVLLMLVFSPWYGYRKWTRSAPWRMFLAMGAITSLGMLTGLCVASARPFSAIDPEKALRAVAVSILFGLAVSSVMVAIARLRLREELMRAAADAERERLERQKVQAELKLLQAQVEPHFLFNTLANLRQLMKSRPEEAVAMLDHLTRYLRTSLPEMRNASSSLGREGELAAAYLEIMRMRMGELEFHVDVPQDLAAHPFPPLMVMTLVENAVKHGVAPVGRGKILVTARRQGERIEVDVLDDGRGLAGELGRGVGLANVRERLKALYDSGASLTLEGAEAGGTRARLAIPA